MCRRLRQLNVRGLVELLPGQPRHHHDEVHALEVPRGVGDVERLQDDLPHLPPPAPLSHPPRRALLLSCPAATLHRNGSNGSSASGSNAGAARLGVDRDVGARHGTEVRRGLQPLQPTDKRRCSPAPVSGTPCTAGGCGRRGGDGGARQGGAGRRHSSRTRRRRSESCSANMERRTKMQRRRPSSASTHSPSMRTSLSATARSCGRSSPQKTRRRFLASTHQHASHVRPSLPRISAHKGAPPVSHSSPAPPSSVPPPSPAPPVPPARPVPGCDTHAPPVDG